MREQIHGGDIYRNQNKIDFSVNSNPLGPPKAVTEAIRAHAGDIVHYPDIRCGRLKAALGKFEGVKEEELICGNGAAELLFAAVQAAKPKKALLPVPSFAEYERALNAAGAKTDYYVLEEKHGFAVREDILERISSDTDILFLCNPNNPTGQAAPGELLKRILNRCKICRTLLVLDECFLDFLEEPERYEMKGYIETYDNLLIVKAFTKTFCMPGLRLGYAVSGSREFLARMEAVCQPWNVSVLAQAGGTAALDGGKAYIEESRRFVAGERTYLIRELEALGYRMYGSLANYVFFRGKKGLYERALEGGFLIRDCENYRGLSGGYYRIAVRTHEENVKLIKWLRESERSRLDG